jgi:hypothetical protein
VDFLPPAKGYTFYDGIVPFRPRPGPDSGVGIRPPMEKDDRENGER